MILRGYMHPPPLKRPESERLLCMFRPQLDRSYVSFTHFSHHSIHVAEVTLEIPCHTPTLYAQEPTPAVKFWLPQAEPVVLRFSNASRHRFVSYPDTPFTALDRDEI